MILGFLGKGGSGKSSVATQMALFLHTQNNRVLAIDADHNMDLTYNLTQGNTPDMKYIGQGLDDIQQYVGLTKGEKYTQAFLSDRTKPFTLSPLDPITDTYSVALNDKLRLMTAGPQTDIVLFGQACSHVLTTALKLYLPLLELQGKEMVVVDEKAGADGVTTGIVTGIDVGVIICEPALHSIKTAKQIAKLMDFYDTPYVFVGNKITNEDDKKFIEEEFKVIPIAYLDINTDIKRNPSANVTEWKESLRTIQTEASKLTKNNRLARTKTKFERNQEFANQ